jgi:hypothetical protein
MDAITAYVPAIEGKSLTTWSVLPGGTHVCLGFAGNNEETHQLILPADALTGLLMTLPRIFQSALDQRFPAGSLRVVYPLRDWRLEQAEGEYGLILRLGTRDGFEVSFTVQDSNASALGDALLAAATGTNTTSPREFH